jgi:hypothetical protein
VHPDVVSVAELLQRSIDLSSAVKAVDPTAEIFGPALYGFAAYNALQDAPDWNALKAANAYNWFIDAYLDEMHKAEAARGRRLLDVLDVHYYSEAKGDDRITDCKNPAHTSCNKARMQASRTLWEKDYYENSWIGQWSKDKLPILPEIKASIDKYYPGTKLAITEYGFGGDNHVSGAIAQADFLGILGREGVCLATLWSSSNGSYPNAAINLYTNYDGKGSSFGSTGVEALASVQDRAGDSNNTDELCTVYAAVNDESNSRLTIVASNKSTENKQEINVQVQGGNYSKAIPYIISTESAVIKAGDAVTLNGNTFSYTLPAMSVALFEVE